MKFSSIKVTADYRLTSLSLKVMKYGEASTQGNETACPIKLMMIRNIK